jgi:hypothetical protein
VQITTGQCTSFNNLAWDSWGGMPVGFYMPLGIANVCNESGCVKWDAMSDLEGYRALLTSPCHWKWHDYTRSYCLLKRNGMLLWALLCAMPCMSWSRLLHTRNVKCHHCVCREFRGSSKKKENRGPRLQEVNVRLPWSLFSANHVMSTAADITKEFEEHVMVWRTAGVMPWLVCRGGVMQPGASGTAKLGAVLCVHNQFHTVLRDVLLCCAESHGRR